MSENEGMNESSQESAPTSRPFSVTVAAIFLFVLAALNVLGALYYLTATSVDTEESVGTVVRVVGVMDLVIGAVQIYAAVKIWALSESGRSMGVVISAIGVGLGLLGVLRGGVNLIVPLALNAFIFYALVREREAFSRRAGSQT